jgi:hypothetical protein
MQVESPFDPRMFLRRFHQNYVNFARLWTRLGRVPDGVVLRNPADQPIQVDQSPDPSIDALAKTIRYVKFMQSVNGKPSIVIEDESDLPPLDRIVVVTRTTSVVTADSHRIVTDIYIGERQPVDRPRVGPGQQAV